MAKPIIELKRVSKEYTVYKHNIERFRSLVFLDDRQGKKRVVFDDISLKIYKGESVAIFGLSGSGKTTLARMLAGYSQPNSGKVTIDGSVTAIFGPLIGMVKSFTGEYNAKIKAYMMGWDEKKFQEKYDEIVEFTELGDKMNQKMRLYERGEASRIDFAVQTIDKPDIFIYDTAFSFKSEAFRVKAVKRLKELADDEDVTFIYTATRTKKAKRYCKRAIVIHEGKIVYDGDIEEAAQFYLENIRPLAKKMAKDQTGDENLMEDDETMEDGMDM